jgi:CRISPR/Cas system-associated endoribonuclease Cas2
LQEALKNPEAFAGELTPEQIRRIKKVSEKIDAQNVKKP